MTSQQMKFAIAKAFGWTGVTLMLGSVYGFQPGQSSCKVECPDYPNDLNACAEFEATLTDAEARLYDETLEFVGYKWQAKPHERCEAFLRVKGLWT